MPILVTGGAGFIGSHLARRLVELGAAVRVIDDLSTGRPENAPVQAHFIRASILDERALAEATRGCQIVFHQAAMVSVPQSVERPDQCMSVNVMGTQRVLDAARAAGVRRVLLASSAAVYGRTPRLPSREDDLVDCWSPYAASKAAGELLLHSHAHCYGLSTVSLRYFNIFGPRQNPNSAYAAAIAAFAQTLTTSSRPTIYGDGLQTRDFTHVDNVVHANLLAASSPRQLRGETINVAAGRSVTLLELLDIMSGVARVGVDPMFAPPRAGDVRHSAADLNRAREVLNYQPLVDLEAGLARMLRGG